MAAHRAPAFRGRAGERALVDRLLDDVRRGQSAVLVVRGEAGVGKTALKVFTKLGIGSRRELQDALRAEEREAAVA
jgi:hypothetical protein